MKRIPPLLLLICLACGPGGSRDTFVLASTTSTQDSGLLDALTAEFEKDFPQHRVKVVAVGSGEAMELGRRGDADVLLVHSPDDEEEFMAAGLGVSRRPVMSNDFVIAGPLADLAGIAGSPVAAEAFIRIANTRSPFVSRGDQSGTHRRELKTWVAAGVNPSGEWYSETGQGMAETIIIASERNAYLLTDIATFTVVNEKAALGVLFRGDPLLVNPYSVIPVKAARRSDAARAFADWITGAEGQTFIGHFGADEYGAPLFVPATNSPE